MKVTARHRRRFLWLFIVPAFCLFIGGGLLWYLVIYRFKDGLKYIIDKESKGRYTFDASKASLSLAKGSIHLEHAVLFCRDTAGADAWCNVQIPDLYFTLSSWKELLFHKKIIVDSLSIVEPFIDIHVYKTAPRKEHVNFQASDILHYLETTLVHFNIHTFSLKDAAFTYQGPGSASPLHGDHISLAVSEFMKVNNEDSHLLGSDKVSLSLGRQHWILSDGRNEIEFGQLRFDSKGQRFELDSVAFSQKLGPGKGEVSIRADKFFFNSRHLPAIYQKEELLLDTLTCVNPVLTLPPYEKEHTAKDSAETVAAKNSLFKKINIGFISVADGALAIRDKDGHTDNASSRKVNIGIYNLDFDPRNDPSLSTDSIRINVKEIAFLTRDSLYKLAIGEFSIHKKDVVFRNVSYGPTRPGPNAKVMTFTAPALRLRNVSIADLLRRHVKASAAELVQPRILFSTAPIPAKSSRALAKTSIAPPNATAGDSSKEAMFYQSLHNISELIDVPDFRITDGAADFRLKGRAPITAAVRRLNAHILLNKFFISDSLVDIKHAIPDWQIGKLNLSTKNVQIEIDNYRLDGVRRNNWGQELSVRTTSGLILKGKNIFWNVFDWDIFQTTKDIQVDSIHISELTIDNSPVLASPTTPPATTTPPTFPTILSSATAASMPPATAPSPSLSAPPPDLPVIRIGKLNIDQAHFRKTSDKTHLSFTASNLAIQNLHSLKRSFEWDGASGLLSTIVIELPNKKIGIGSVSFDTEKETTLKDLSFQSGDEISALKIFLPSVRINTDLHSSNLDLASVRSLVAGQVDIRYTKISRKDTQTVTKTGPKTLTKTETRTITQAGTQPIPNSDTLTLATQVDLQATNIHPPGSKDPFLRYDEIRTRWKNSHFTKGQVGLGLEESSLQLSGGSLGKNKVGRLTLTTHIDFGWDGGRLHYQKDSTTLLAEGLAGSFRQDTLSFTLGGKFDWLRLLPAVALSKGKINYQDKKISAKTAALSWQPAGRILELTDFEVIPNRSREETFHQAVWQGDYITVKGESLSLAGASFHRGDGDSSIHANKISISGVSLTASRDKNIPFRHGTEQPMPTKLINKIPVPVKVDSIQLSNTNIIYNELSAATGKWSAIPIEDLNGTILNINNRDNHLDTLKVFAIGKLFDGHIRRFSYLESYGDSLSGFSAGSSCSPLDLTRFSQVSIPAAAVSVSRGHADTLFASWAGNKYASYGTMNFFYEDLHIKVLNKKDSTKGGFLPAVKTWLANLILPNGNRRPSAIFVERDREKFVFNYWVKTQTSGFLTTIGIKKNRKYRKLYQQKYKQFGLPPTAGNMP